MRWRGFLTTALSAVLLLSGCGGGLPGGSGGDLDFPQQYRWTRAVKFGFPDAATATDIRGAHIPTKAVGDPGKFTNAFAHWVDGAGQDCTSEGGCTPRLVVDAAQFGVSSDIDIVVQDQDDLTRSVTREKATPNAILMDDDGTITRAVSQSEAGPTIVVIEEREKDEKGRAVGGLYATCTVYLPDSRNNYLGRAVIRVRSDVTGDLLTGVANHEAGHALGLMHSSRFEDAMYAFVYGVKARAFGLTSNDNRRIRELYAPLSSPAP